VADYEADNKFKLDDWPDDVFPTLRHTNKWDHKQCNHDECMRGQGLYTLDEDIVMVYQAQLDALKETFERLIQPRLEEQGWDQPFYTKFRDEE
jgi:hypothetical protein